MRMHDPAVQRILVVEPDARLREWCRLHLTTLGYTVTALADSAQVLELCRGEPPSLVLIATDAGGPSPYAVAAALRSSPATAAVPIVFVVPDTDASALSQARAIDSQAVLTKPLARPAFLEAVLSRLSPPEFEATSSVGGLLVGGVRLNKVPQPAPGLLVEAKDATVLVVVLRNLVSLARSMRAKTLEVLVERFASDARDIIERNGGWCIRSDATGMVALFESGPYADRTPTARAIESALLVTLAGRRVKRWADATLSDTVVPPLSIGCGVHTGEVIVTRLSVSGQLSPSIAGQTADIAMRLNGRAKGLGWSVTASESAAFLAGARFKFGRRATLTDTDHAVTIPVIEVLGFNPGTARPGELPLMAEVREAVLANAVLSRLAGDADPRMADKTIMVTARRPDLDEVFPEIPERRIARKLGGDGQVASYACVHLPTDREEFLRSVSLELNAPDLVDAYLERFRMLSGLEQRNVITVYEVGRTPTHGYVAAEWLGGGTLTDALRKKLPVGLALNYLAQMCMAVDALHSLGLTHGALTSDHFRLREENVVVLAHVNAIEQSRKVVAASAGAAHTRAVDGDATSADTRRDFQALGFILHGMLTADPSLATSTLAPSESVLTAATRLPIELAPLQPCLDGLLGVGLNRPTERAEEVLVGLLDLRETFPFDVRSADAGPGADLMKE